MYSINGKDYRTLEEVSEMLGFGVQGLRARIRAGKIDGYLIGKRKYYDEAHIQQMIETRLHVADTKKAK